ncbi:MAG: hypothetical protein GXP27_08040 [Planctomycetes bacterium]|nr:hypothetical protein [Planctomycetota bacterium]
MLSTEGIDFSTIFATRREYCRILLEMSRRQFELVQNADYAGLLELLGRKQRLLGRLDQLNQSHPDLWEQWRQRRDYLPAEARSRCERILKESEDLLAQVLAQEKQGTDLLTAQRDATQQQLETIAQGIQTQEAYRDHLAPATHRRLDVNQ